MKIPKEQIIGFIIITAFFVFMGYTIELPLFQYSAKKQILFEALTPIELFFLCFSITCVYFLVTYFVLPSQMIKNLKACQAPIQEAYTTKFEYWLKSLLFEDEVREQEHLLTVEDIKNRIENARINVLVEAAKLNDMTVSTFLKHLTAEADVNLTNAKTEMEKTKAETLALAIKSIEKFPPIWQAYIISCVIGSTREFHNDLDIQRDITEYVKQMKEQEVKKAKAEADAYEQKMKHEQKKYVSNDKV